MAALTIEERLRNVARGLETGEMSRTYAAIQLRRILADIATERQSKNDERN